MAAAAFTLLLLAVAGVLARPFRIPAWVVPVACVVLALGTHVASVTSARDALGPLAAPIAFLLTAVPLSIALDHLGFFAAVAARLIDTGRGSGSLWLLAAAVTTVLNLDASVVLLTPLYVHFARRTGRDPLTLAFQPVLLACLASSALPVSNLTNLIAASATSADTVGFLTHLALPSLVATTVGWARYRRVLEPDRLVSLDRDPDPGLDPRPGPGLSAGGARHPRPLRTGGAVLGFVLAGFTIGPVVGLEPWMVALAADIALVAILRRAPWRDIPFGTALVAGALGVLAAAAVAQVPIERLFHGTGSVAVARTIAVAASAANVINNLPALLVALPATHLRVSPTLWGILIGVNMGPVVLVTGSLASLLWLDAVHRLGIAVRPRDFTRVGVTVGLPAVTAGVATFLLLGRVVG